MDEMMEKLYQSRGSELNKYMEESPAPAMENLEGCEFDGVNTPWYTTLMAIKKFKKGFYKGKPRAEGPEPFLQGYNIPVKQNGLSNPWIAKPKPESPKHFGFFRVFDAEKSSSDKKYPQSLLLDYGLGGNFFLAPEKFLRDYIVQPFEDRPDIILGKAYVALGFRIPVSFFILCKSGEVTYKDEL